MLWYLHLCSVNNIVVVDYQDQAGGVMIERSDGSGYFKEVVLHPVITLSIASPANASPANLPTSNASSSGSALIERATALHHEAGKMCFIANSCNFPIRHEPDFRTVTPVS